MRWLRRLGVFLGVLLLVVAVSAATVYAMSESKLGAKYTVPDEPPVVIAPDSSTLARGEHLTLAIAKCVGCHGDDLGGGVVIDAPPVGRVEATNLTTGKGGVLPRYDDAALERAIRHGIASDGRSLLIMPSTEYRHLSDADVGALIAYIRSRPPVDREHAPARLGPLLRALWVAGKVDPAPAAIIAHDARHATVTPVGNNEAAGKYIAENGCSGCHGETYSGGPIPGTPPDWKPPANLTPTGIGHYSLADFTRILRDGKRPDGSAVDKEMPVQATRLMTDDEIEAVYKFLRTVPRKEYGGR